MDLNIFEHYWPSQEGCTPVSTPSKRQKPQAMQSSRLQVEFSDFLLDVDQPWWEKWGTSFERGILDWVRSRPNLLRFRMKRLKRDLHEQIQQLLRERLQQRAALDARRRLEEETDDADELRLFGSSDEEDLVNVANLFGSDPGSPLQDDLPVSPNSPEDSLNLFGSDDD